MSLKTIIMNLYLVNYLYYQFIVYLLFFIINFHVIFVSYKLNNQFKFITSNSYFNPLIVNYYNSTLDLSLNISD